MLGSTRLQSLLAVAAILAACSSEHRGAAASAQQQPSRRVAAASAEESAFRLTATVQELMDAELDPAADFLWDSVATISRVGGVEERQPRTDEEWQEVRRHALQLLEATNLLVMSGRQVSRTFLPGSVDGGDLDSQQIQAKIDAQRPAFNAFAHGVHDAGSQMLRAIDAHDATSLFDLGSVLDQACENCHTTFWFPNQKPR